MDCDTMIADRRILTYFVASDGRRLTTRSEKDKLRQEQDLVRLQQVHYFLCSQEIIFTVHLVYVGILCSLIACPLATIPLTGS